jgi:hypothetical protein
MVFFFWTVRFPRARQSVAELGLPPLGRCGSYKAVCADGWTAPDDKFEYRIGDIPFVARLSCVFDITDLPCRGEGIQLC